ncbi:MAG: [Fe-Fe] hydrogenase large subunit C-terminal domain-containing protein [Bacillota bacterium]|jgi:iron only hydrogenase large subunit-like protein
MNRIDITHNILVNLAKHIKAGNDKKRDKLIRGIIEECLPEKKNDPETYRLVERHLNYLLETPQDTNPPLVEMLEEICPKCSPQSQPCSHVCPTGAITCEESGLHKINHDLCVECGHCVNSCISGAIVARSEFAQVATMLLQSTIHPVYAILAPSFVGQFGREVSPEIFKSALRSLGFTEVYEVALAADITTIYEAEEFVERMHQDKKFMITSCCCPAFIKFIEKLRPKVANLVSPTVSPMIAMGRMLKKKDPNCRVVFIGPCIAKKNEAKRPDLQPAVDCVLTFKETKALLEAAEIKLDGSLGRTEINDASHDGRIFAHTGGVTEAIIRAVRRFDPNITVKPVKGNGLKQCGELLREIEEGKIEANFMEGMGCPGGCVGGPGTIIDVEEAAQLVKDFAQRSSQLESFENSTAMQWMELFYKPTHTTSEKIDLHIPEKYYPPEETM